MSDAPDLETVSGRKDAFDAWSARTKRHLGRFAGLRLSKTNTGGVAFSRHWPHLLCWTWSVWLQPWRGAKWDGAPRLHWYRLGNNGGGQIGLSLWFVTLGYHWQSYRIAGFGWRDQIVPIYHREREPA
jgi:hypothetical protein